MRELGFKWNEIEKVDDVAITLIMYFFRYLPFLDENTQMQETKSRE
jgi:hypothetical protein